MLYKLFLVMLVYTLTVSSQVVAQPDQFDDLLILYVDEEYEKLLKRAERYTENSDTRRDPRPVLYLSKAYFEMSKRDEYTDKYPRAFRDALKYASRYSRRDKEREYFDENRDFLNELRGEAMREAGLFMSGNDVRGMSQAARIYKALVDLDSEDAGAAMIYSAVLYKINRRGEADVVMREMAPKLPHIDFDRMTDDQKEMLKFGTIHYAEYLKDQGMLDSARVTMRIVEPYFEDDNEFQLSMEEIR